MSTDFRPHRYFLDTHYLTMLLDSPILDSPFTQVTQTVFDKDYYHILVVV